MNDFLLSEKFRLEVHWENPIYEKEGSCRFSKLWFSGPALQIAQKINNGDHIMLDVYSQYIHLVKGAFVIKLAWKEVKYDEDGGRVFLSDAKLEHDNELNNVPKLNDTDYFVIDTSNHESSIHHYNLVYKTLLINSNNTIYRFEK